MHLSLLLWLPLGNSNDKLILPILCSSFSSVKCGFIWNRDMYYPQHITSCPTGFLDLENVCLDTKIMCLRCLEAEILPDFRKNSRHFENPRWLPQDAWKKCKHCFSGSVGPKVSKNVQFTKSPKILNANIFCTGLELRIISSAHDVMKLILLFYVCHSTMGLTRFIKRQFFKIIL